MKLNWPLPTAGEFKAGFLLSPSEIHLWCANLDDQLSDLEYLPGCLSGEEQQRAARYHFESDRRRFVARRALLRRLLEQYLNIPAGDLLFLSNPYGRPFLDPRQAPAGLDFNLSHSNGIALYAFALQRHVGVDIESPQREIGIMQIAARFFSPLEAHTLAGLPVEQRQAAFYRCWTRKEAYIKGRGMGLSLPLDSFDVSLAPGEAAALLATRPAPQDAQAWELCELDPVPEVPAALAYSRSSASPGNSAAAPPRITAWTIPGVQSPVLLHPESRTI